MNPVRVVLVDDHRLVRQGLHCILNHDPRFEVVGEAANGRDALRIIAEQRPEAVLLDLKLPDLGGVEVCERILQAAPSTVVVILTAYLDLNLVDACLRAGARGYLLKDAENLHLREQILAAVQGHTALDPRAADVVTDYIHHYGPPHNILSQREMDILRHIAKGLSNKEIGDQLHLSENTIKGHLKDILAKMGAHNRIDAVLLAKERGLI